MSDVSSAPVILLVFANDRRNADRYLRNLPDELRKLRDVLRPAVEGGLCEVVELANATADDIFSVFQSREYRGRIAVFHFGGHAGSYDLLLETTEGAAASANAGGLATFLGQQNSLQLVFLNGCSTQQQTQGLLNEGVDAVVTTATAINDHVATQLAVRFYRALASGVGLQTAFNEAVAAAMTEAGGQMRALYAESETDGSAISERCPWDLYLREGAEAAAEWNLPETADNPLFGLPPLPPNDLPASPYRHLQWFRKEQAAVFFGRGKDIRDLYVKVTNADTAPIVLFYGQSGVGKSSLLDAGLIPRLESSQHVLYLRRDAQQGLSGTLNLAFLPDGVGLSARNGWKAREHALGRPMTVILDQVEEIFTRPCGAVSHELKLFLDDVANIFSDRSQRPHGRLILGFRKEWLAEIKRQLNEFRLPYSEVFLQNPDRRGVIEVVNGPMNSPLLRSQYNLTIQPGVAQQIADDLLEDAAGAVAPTMQILLSRMWETATANGASAPEFTRDLYTSMRRQGLLLRHFLNRQLNFIQEQWPDIVSPDLLLDLLSLHTTPLGTAEERDLTELQQLYTHHSDQLPRILEGCKDAYLLTLPSSSQDSSAATRLAHDTLAPLVRERYEKSDHPGQRARRILENRVIEWQDGAEGTPLDEQDLSIVEAGREGMRSWSVDEQRLIKASLKEREKRLRAARIRKIMGLAAVAAIVLSAGLAFQYAITADQQRNNAQQQTLAARRATARSLVLPLREFEEVTVDFVPRTAALTNPELDSLWSVLSSDDEHVHQHVFEAVFREPQIAERVTNRSDAVVRAAVGLDNGRRQDVLAIIDRVLSGESAIAPIERKPAFSLFPMPLQVDPPEQFPEPDWRVVQACAALAHQLKPIENGLSQLIATRLVAEIEKTRDPRILSEVGFALIRFRTHLQPDQITTAWNALFAADLSRTSGNFPPRLAPTLNAIAEVAPSHSALTFLKTAVDRWMNAQHSERIALESAVLRLADRVPEADGVAAWQYLWDNCQSYPQYRPPADLFAAMATLARKSPAVATHVAAVVFPMLKNSEELYSNFFGWSEMLKEIRASVPPDKLAALVGRDDQWKSDAVRNWAAGKQPRKSNDSDNVRKLADVLVKQWTRDGKTLNVVHWGVTNENVHAVIAEITQRCCEPEANQHKVSKLLSILAAISPDGSLIDRHAIQRALLTRLPDADAQEIRFSISQTLKNLSAVGLPIPKPDQQRILAIVVDGLKASPPLGSASIAEAALTLDGICHPKLMTELAPATLHALSHAEFLNDRQAFAKLLVLPALSLTTSQKETARPLIHQLYLDVLFPKQGDRNSYDIRELPTPADCLTEEQQTRLAQKIETLLLNETHHHALAALGRLRGKFCKPIESERCRQLMTKLSLWLYRLPPAYINSSPPINNTDTPSAVCQAVLALESQAADRDRLVAAHAVMHAMLQQDFQPESGQTLRHTLQTLASQLTPASLISAMKAPWCVDDAQQVIMQAIETSSGIKLNSGVWNLSEAAESMKLPIERLAVRETFPPELRYDAVTPTYLSNVAAGDSQLPDQTAAATMNP